MSSQREEWAEESGPGAVDWFGAAYPEAAGSIFDNALTAVAQAFGPSAEIELRAVAASRDERPRDLFLSVRGDVMQERDWERLVAAHRVLLEMEAYRPDLAEVLLTFHLVLERHLPDALPYPMAVDNWFEPR
jgi:hypothetical protein